MELFKMINDEVVVNYIEILVYKDFQALYDKDRTTDKVWFKNCLKYMWLYANPEAYPSTSCMKDSEAAEYALEHSGIVKADITPLFKRCMDIYAEALTDIVERLIKTVNRTLINLTDSVEAINKDIETKKKDPTEAANLIGLADNVFEIAEGIPKHIRKLDDLLMERKQQKEGKKLVRGGREYKPSFDGKGESDRIDTDSEPTRVSL